jgi:hypothetical protein
MTLIISAIMHTTMPKFWHCVLQRLLGNFLRIGGYSAEWVDFDEFGVFEFRRRCATAGS